jgi:hypothetical protein
LNIGCKGKHLLSELVKAFHIHGDLSLFFDILIFLQKLVGIMSSYKLVLLSVRCFRMPLVGHFIAVHLVCFFLFNAHLFLVLLIIVLSLVLLLELYYHVRLVSFTLLDLVLSL